MKAKAMVLWGALVLSGCAGTDGVLRPEHATYIDASKDLTTLPVHGNYTAQVRCLDKASNSPNLGEPVGDLNRCLYYSVDEKHIMWAFGQNGPSADARDSYISFLLNISEHNCTTFLNRAFANKSAFDTSRGTFQDVLTGLSAASANGSPHAAAGLEVVNLVVGKSIDNINSTYFFEKTFQALAASIQAEREIRRKVINDEIKKPYKEFTIYDSLAAVHRFDNACSIRVGLEKLQGLAQEAAANNASLAEQKEQLTKQSVEAEKTRAALVDLATRYASAIKQTQTSYDDLVTTATRKVSGAKKREDITAISQELKGMLASRQQDSRKLEDLLTELASIGGSIKLSGDSK